MNIYKALETDHNEIKRLLNELCALEEGDNTRHELVDQIKRNLIPHARAEESVFYNTLRTIDADKNLSGHGYTEHMAAEGLLRTLQGMEKADSGWKGIAKKLRDAVFHHIQEEETSIFEEARSALSDDEANAIGEAFLSLKPKLEDQGAMKNTVDMVKNMMPPRFSKKVSDLGNESHQAP